MVQSTKGAVLEISLTINFIFFFFISHPPVFQKVFSRFLSFYCITFFPLAFAAFIFTVVFTILSTWTPPVKKVLIKLNQIRLLWTCLLKSRSDFTISRMEVGHGSRTGRGCKLYRIAFGCEYFQQNYILNHH